MTARKILPLLTEFHYVLEEHDTLEDFTLSSPEPGKPKLHFKLMKDDLTRSILYLRGRADVLFNTLSLTKTNWMKAHGHTVLAAQGHHLAFLGFNYNDSTLKDVRVRRAIALTLPLKDWVEYKFMNWVTLYPDAIQNPDLAEANRLLDEAGYPVKEDGYRFTLKYVTTPVREGNEMAYLNREALRKIGIEVKIKLLESSLFFAKLKSGDFQLFGSVMLRNSEQDAVSDYLAKGSSRNYFHYESPELQKRLESNSKLSWGEVRDLVLRDIPLVPLYEWKHGLVLSDRMIYPPKIEETLDDSFRFLTRLQIK